MRTVVNSLEESDDPVDSDGKCLCVFVRFEMISFDRKSGGAEEAHCLKEEIKTQKLMLI